MKIIDEIEIQKTTATKKQRKKRTRGDRSYVKG